MDRNRLYILHILDAIETIEEYVAGFDFNKFSDDRLVQDGVIRQFSIIGEAAKRLSEDMKEEYKEIPWKDICGMRDNLIHDYMGIDLDEVWKTATQDLNSLREVLNKHLGK